jgi:hypothetical protein
MLPCVTQRVVTDIMVNMSILLRSVRANVELYLATYKLVCVLCHTQDMVLRRWSYTHYIRPDNTIILSTLISVV